MSSSCYSSYRPGDFFAFFLVFLRASFFSAVRFGLGRVLVTPDLITTGGKR